MFLSKLNFQLDHICTLTFLTRIQGVLTHLTHRWDQRSCHKLQSLGGHQWSEYFSRQLVPVLSSWSHSHHYFKYPVMLHAIFPLSFAVISCVCWLAVECCYCRIEGEGDEAAFNQQLAPHKAFITPKRLRLPKPEWDKHCPFICNDVEARGNWTELRGKTLTQNHVWTCPFFLLKWFILIWRQPCKLCNYLQ